MTDNPPHITFAELRREAIDHAQHASGELWTDYNLHDPGVTLLEQTCFALSQTAYQADFPVRDLLTDQNGAFAAGVEHPQYNPRKVLRSAPVTLQDLNAYLSDLPGVARAWVDPAREPGLYDAVVVPAEDQIGAKRLETIVREGFARIRPLCTGLGRVVIAKQQRVILKGEVEISDTVLPERVAAELYHAVSVILRGLPYTRTTVIGATRDDVYDDPIALWRRSGARRTRSPDLHAHLKTLRDIPGIRNITELELDPLDRRSTGVPNFYATVRPVTDGQVGLDFTLNGLNVDLSAATIREELMRITAEQISTTHHHVTQADWQVRYGGQDRSFEAAHVDTLLPGLYPAHGYQHDRSDVPLAAFRNSLETHLDLHRTALAELPAIFAARTDPALDDPVLYRQRIALLDYRIALHGETLPATRHTGLHHYRSARERHAFELAWRQRILHALTEINAAKGVGPGGWTIGGFLGYLGLLADLPITPGNAAAPLTACGFQLAAEAPQQPARVANPERRRDLNPFDMLVPLDDQALPYDDAILREQSPWVSEGVLSPALYARAADPFAFTMAPDDNKGWQVLFDYSDGLEPILIAAGLDKTDGLETVHRLRASWRALHERSEGCYLIEDVGFAGSRAPYRANCARLLITSWTARTRLDAYRGYVAQLVQRLAPAHVKIDVFWLDHPHMARFEELREIKPTPDGQLELHAFLQTLEPAQ